MHLIRVPRRPDRRRPSGSRSASSTRRRVARLLLLEHGARRDLPRLRPGHARCIALSCLPVATADFPNTAADASTWVRVCWPAVVGRRLRCCSMTAASFAPHHLGPSAVGPGGGLVVIRQGFAVDPPVQFRVGGELARPTRVSGQAVTVTVPAGLEGGRTPVRVDGVPGETAYIEVATPLATGLHHVDSPVFDAGQSLRHLQRLPRSAGADLGLRRPAGRHARAVRRRRAQSHVDGVRSRGYALRVAPVRRQRLWIASDGDASTSQRISGSPAASRSVQTARCMSAIDRARFFASRTDAPRCWRVSRRASRPFTWPSAPTASCTSPRRRSRRATACTACRRTATSASSTTASAGRRGWPSTSAGSLRGRCARGLERRLPVARRSPGAAAPGHCRRRLIGLAFDPRGGLVFGSRTRPTA